MLALFATASAAQDNEFSFKGVKFGASESELLAAFPSARCTDAQKTPRFCTVKDTYAGAAAVLRFTLTERGVRTMTATFHARDLDPIVQAVSARFGKPDDTSTGTAAYGATNWFIKNPEGHIIARARRMESDPTQATIFFIPMGDVEEAAKRRAVERQKDM